MNLSVKELMRLEVDWYRKHGRHPERIVKDRLGNERVVSDCSWNFQCPRQRERLKPRMYNAIMDSFYGYKA